jgi:ribokinase
VAGLTTVLNPAPARALPARLARYVDILIPNEVEAAALCGQTVRTLPQARQAARRLQHMGYRSVVITRGKHGVIYTAEQDIVHLPGLEVPVKAQRRRVIPSLAIWPALLPPAKPCRQPWA